MQHKCNGGYYEPSLTPAPPDVTIKLEQVEHIKEEDNPQPGLPDDSTLKLENLETAVYEGIPIKQETEEEVNVEDTSQLLNTSLKLGNLDTSIFQQNIDIKLEKEEDFKVEDIFEPVYDFLEHIDSRLEIPVSKGSGNKSYKCNVCSYATAYKNVLTTHSRIHTGLLPFSCIQCDYKCNTKRQLKQHTSKHTGEKPYKCNLCSYATAYKHVLTVHSRIHTGLYPFSCTLCDYKCNTKQHLVHHTSKHTGEKPHKCDVCSYATAAKYNLARHYKRHSDQQMMRQELMEHTIICDQPYKCDSSCSFGANTKSYLVEHEVVKYPKPSNLIKYCDTCLQCGKLFVVASAVLKSDIDLNIAAVKVSSFCSNCSIARKSNNSINNNIM